MDVYSVKLQATGRLNTTTRISIPKEIIDFEAKRRQVSLKLFLKIFRLQLQHDVTIGTLHANFVPNGENESSKSSKENK